MSHHLVLFSVFPALFCFFKQRNGHRIIESFVYVSTQHVHTEIHAHMGAGMERRQPLADSLKGLEGSNILSHSLCFPTKYPAGEWAAPSFILKGQPCGAGPCAHRLPEAP